MTYYNRNIRGKGNMMVTHESTPMNFSALMKDRIGKLRAQFSVHQIDAFLVLAAENRFYLSGFSAEDHQFDELSGALLITPSHLVLATDSRFELQAQMEAPLCEVVIYKKGLAAELPKILPRLKIRRLGFECSRLSVGQFNLIQKECQENSTAVQWIPLEELVESLRLIKSSIEIENTKAALALAESVFVQVAQSIRPGMTEKMVAWALEKGMREAGADNISFPVIVAAGPNSALPHAVPSDHAIAEGEPILFDWGAKLNGYCSDTSRTLFLGKPDDTFTRVYVTVLTAQQRAIGAIRSGASSKAVDSQARGWIDQQGFEGKFGHGLGHGTGLAVHEGPRLSPLKETKLQSGMIVTVEPGIYLPQWGGVRIENQVLVTDQGCQVLNRLPLTFDISQIKAS